jgi:hypothetical protein
MSEKPVTSTSGQAPSDPPTSSKANGHDPAAAGSAAVPAAAGANAPAAESKGAGETPAGAASPPADAPVKSLISTGDPAKREGAEAKAESKPNGEAKAEPPSTPAESGVKPPASEAKPDGKAAKETDGQPPLPKEPEAAKPPEEAKDKGPAEALAEKPPVPPSYAALNLPEGVTLDNERLAQADKLFGDLETASKADHAAVEAMRQQFADFHVAEIKAVIERVQKHQTEAWNRTNEGWINEVKNHPVIGGNRLETALGSAKYAIQSMMGMNAKETEAFLNAMEITGVGNHPAFALGFYRLFEKYRESQFVPGFPSQPKGGWATKQPGNRGWYDDDKTPPASAVPS